MHILKFLGAAAAGLLLAGGETQAAGEVYVVGALQRLHATEEGFTYADLRKILEAAKADVLVLEVRPDELAARGETPGRPEYPQVVWPFLAGAAATAMAMEPGGETFARMTGRAGAAIEAMKARDPKAAADWSRAQASLEAGLQAHWRRPADAHDRVTADLAEAVAARQADLVGGGYDALQGEWDGYMAEQAREAVLANPGKRVLVLASYRNRHVIEAALRAVAPERVVDMPAWLRGATAPPAPGRSRAARSDAPAR